MAAESLLALVQSDLRVDLYKLVERRPSCAALRRRNGYTTLRGYYELRGASRPFVTMNILNALHQLYSCFSFSRRSVILLRIRMK